MVFTGCIWLRVETSVAFRVHKMWVLSRIAGELLTSDEGLCCTQLLVSSSSVRQSFSQRQSLVRHITFGPIDRTPFLGRTIELELCSLYSDLLRVPDHVIKRSDLTPFMCYAIFCLSCPCYDTNTESMSHFVLISKLDEGYLLLTPQYTLCLTQPYFRCICRGCQKKRIHILRKEKKTVLKL